MKFFSLIRGDEVRLSKKQKVIPADTFSKLVDANDLLEEVRSDAANYRQEVVEEGEKLKESAEASGFEAGLAQWTEQIQLLETEIAQVSEQLHKLILPVALQAAKKVVGREMSLNPETIADIVATNLKAVAGHQKVTVYCNKEDLDKVKAKNPNLSAFLSD